MFEMVRMETDYSFLHKILKDSTRRDILRYLNDRPLTYMELMNLSKVTNTGKLNYHLKVLGELIQKTADDKYSLTETGRLAVQLLEKFSSKPIQGKSVSSGTVIVLSSEWKREIGLDALMVVSMLAGLFLIFFSVIFLERPWPHGPISLTSIVGIVVGTGLIVLSLAVRKMYLTVKERNKQTLISQSR